MGFFNFGKFYTQEDLQREITKLQKLYREALGSDATLRTKAELKSEMTKQLHEVLVICRKGKFYGGEMVEWCPTSPSYGCYTSLRSVTPVVQTMIDLM